MRSATLLFALAPLVACGGDDSSNTRDLSASVGDMAQSNADFQLVPPGPGATLLCESSGKNAFTTYGATAFIKVNDQIFANVQAELAANSTTNLGSSFGLVGTGNPPSTADSQEAFQGNLAAFLVYAYGGPSFIQYSDGVTYYGVRDMAAAHAGLNITQAQYTYFVTSIIIPALTANGVPAGSGDSPNDVASCFAPVLTDTNFVASIVGK